MKPAKFAWLRIASLFALLLGVSMNASAGVLDAAVVTAIGDGETAATAVLTAAVAILALFLLWKVIRRSAGSV